MKILRNISGIIQSQWLRTIPIAFVFIVTTSCGNPSANSKGFSGTTKTAVSQEELIINDDVQTVTALMVSPKNPRPGEVFRVLVTGSRAVQQAKVQVTSPAGKIESLKSRSGEGLPFWQIAEFKAGAVGKYQVTFRTNNSSVVQQDLWVTNKPAPTTGNAAWNSGKGWDAGTEDLYSAWVNALFNEADERASWTALHLVTQNKGQNFLYNYLSLNEDDPAGKEHVLMQPDCADNPFYLRAYFAWKLGLPFGFHAAGRVGGEKGPPPA